MCVLVAGGGHGGHVDPVDLVLHEVEVPCENGGVCVVWWDFAANFFVEHGALWFFVVAGVVVGVNDLERAHGFVVEGDAEGSSFFNLLNVATCYVAEFLEECGSDEDDDAGILSVLVAPEGFKAFYGGPSGVVSFRGVCFLKADDVRLRCQSE